MSMSDHIAGPRYLSMAARLGDRLCQDALWDGDRCSWGGAAMEPVDRDWANVWRTAGPTIYEGTAGIALFLGRLHSFTGGTQHADAARGAMRQAISRVETIPPGAAYGFYAGRLGIAFAAEAVGRLCRTPHLLETASRLAKEALDADVATQESDVISGLAGAIPALIALSARLSDDGLLVAALRCGEALLSREKQHPHGSSWPATWDTTGPDLVGYSHGTAGIAVGLLELHAISGDGRFRMGADRAHTYERHWFDPVQGNWPDLRFLGSQPGAQPGFPVYWCHGACGIGFARLRVAAITGDPVLRAEAETAVATTARMLDALAGGSAAGGFDANFSLCHGMAGNADLMLSAADQLDDPELRRRAYLVGDLGIARHGSSSAWPCGVPGGGETPGLLLGLAGIG
ncbi:MAG: lanthionine synthetase LanC family protein, partial [Rhodopila sp.]|nr:lanthionine synthetase LanC family protein [Rhodopila sp.]